MKIWLVQTGEELPIDGQHTRLMRTANLASELRARGHDVLFFNSTFNHQQKKQRHDDSRHIADGAPYPIQLLRGRPYKRNFSFRRMASHRDNAKAFRAIAPTLVPPDVILCGYPPLELAEACAQYALSRDIPFAIDCRDMWPEIILDRVPVALRPIAWPAHRGMLSQKRRILKGATAITGITDAFVRWGQAAAGRPPSPLDRSFHLSISQAAADVDSVEAAAEIWRQRLDAQGSVALVGCFAGALAARLDIRTLLDGVDLLDADERGRVRIVLCGKGDLEQEIVRRSLKNPAIVAGGWCNNAELKALMQRADFGILPYPNTSDFLASYPNKVGEYLLAGLPILTALDGVTGTLLDESGLKLAYHQGSPPSVADSLRRLLREGGLDVLRPIATRVGNQHFNPETIYPAFADWLEMLADRKRHGQ